MTNRFIHLILCPFTGVGIRPFRGDEWFAYRIKIFKEYTLKSLLNQSHRGFLLWLTFRREERFHPYVKELENYLREQKIMTIMTFSGLPYWDDKFNAGLKEKFMNTARVLRMAWREKSLNPILSLPALLEDKNKTLKDRLEIALGEIKANLVTDKFDWVYVSRIDSDDMFEQDFVADVQKFPPFPGALTCREGYVYNSNTGQLAEWNPKTNPPFHTIIFPKDTFFDPGRYLQYFKSFRSHEDIPSVFNSQNLKGRKYCVTIHQQHISTIWNHPWKGKEIEGEEKKEILQQFLGGSNYWKMDGLKFAKADGRNLACKEIINDYIAHKQQGRDYEPETTKVIKSLVKEGDVCVDVGASIGYMTMQLARASKTKVLAFEPTANQCEYIKKNAELNGFEVEVHNLAAWDNETDTYVRRDVKVNKDMKEHLNDPQKIQVNAGYENKIKGCVLDNVLPEKVDFIKMDIDGSEPRALKGLVKTFERNPQLRLVVEYYPKCIQELGNDPAEMMAILDKYFTYERIPGDYNEEYYNLICKRK